HATTDASGLYLFTEPPGTYTVTVDASNFTGTGALVGFSACPTLNPACGTALDSNPNPSGTTPGTLPGGSSDLTLDFGYYQRGSINGSKLLAVATPGESCRMTGGGSVFTVAGDFALADGTTGTNLPVGT